jgi:tetratricopeptide (TPR) repeat protein
MADAPPIQPDSTPPDMPPDLPPDLPPDMPPELPPDRPHNAAAGTDQDVLWSQVWQLPVLLFGLGLLVIGVYLALPGRDPDRFHERLADAELLLESDKLEDAKTALDEVKVRIHEAPTPEKDYFWRLYADLNFLQLYKTGVVGREGVDAAVPTYERIVEYYGNAQANGRELTGQSLRHYIRSLVALGRDSQALGLLDKMTGPQAAQRYLIVRDMIEHRRDDRPGVDTQSLLPLLTRFREDIKAIPDPALARQQEVWAYGFQASLSLQAGDPQGAIGYLLRHIQRLAARGGDDDLAPLIILLAKAYQGVDDFKEAEQQYRYAQQKLDPTDDLNADVLVGLGQLALTPVNGRQVEEALEYFRSAEEGYPSSTSAHITALIGRADCEAKLGDHAAARRYYELAVREMLDRTRPWDPRRKDASRSINTQFERAVDQDQYDRAKDYLDVLALLQGDNPSPELLLNLAHTCERIGDLRREEASQSAQRRPGQPPLSDDARRLANQQAAEYYAKAAAYYYRHANAVTIEDNQQHGESLWGAAVNYDRAQMWPDAIRVYEQFILTRDGDPKRLRAISNLAKAYMADRRFKPALAQFQKLVEDYPRSPETYSSLVPMARCQDALGEPLKAIKTLELVIDDHEAITPDNGEYRDALIELGRLHHRLGEQDPAYYARAIELLTEAVQRYGQTDRGPTLRFLLADANRRSVPALQKQAESTQSHVAQLGFQDEVNDRLQQAQILFNQAINGLEAKRTAQGGLTPIEQLYLRNAYFYQADCAYDRRVFEQAIQLYNTAATNYSDDPASLVARIQIVNAYCELGQFQQAKVANDTARRQLEQIPDSAFEDKNLPMKREHWEDWLRWTSERNLFSRQANAAGVGG